MNQLRGEGWRAATTSVARSRGAAAPHARSPRTRGTSQRCRPCPGRAGRSRSCARGRQQSATAAWRGAAQGDGARAGHALSGQRAVQVVGNLGRVQQARLRSGVASDGEQSTTETRSVTAACHAPAGRACGPGHTTWRRRSRRPCRRPTCSCSTAARGPAFSDYREGSGRADAAARWPPPRWRRGRARTKARRTRLRGGLLDGRLGLGLGRSNDGAVHRLAGRSRRGHHRLPGERGQHSCVGVGRGRRGGRAACAAACAMRPLAGGPSRAGGTPNSKFASGTTGGGGEAQGGEAPAPLQRRSAAGRADGVGGAPGALRRLRRALPRQRGAACVLTLRRASKPPCKHSRRRRAPPGAPQERGRSGGASRRAGRHEEGAWSAQRGSGETETTTRWI